MKNDESNFNTSKKTICLNMIVRNEAHIIASTLQNILDHIPIDYWVISDTGSTDNTIDIIDAFFREKNIPGETFNDEWKDFGHNRTKMLEHAFNKTDYVFIFDADDLICGNTILPLGSNILTKDAYYIPFENPVSYHRLILASNRMRWKYVGVLHEYIVNIDPIKSEEYLSGDYYINSRRLGNRSKNPNKYLDDAITLENAFQMETVDIHLKNRYAYYCAQSYHDAGKHEKAIEWYEKTLTLDYSPQYKYIACIRAGDCYMHLKNPDGAIKIWGKAYEYDKERPEAISNIMEYYYKNGVHFMVTALYNQFKSRIDFDITIEQSKYKVFLDYSKFHNIHYYNSISGYYSGDFLSAYEGCKYLLLHDTNTLYMENAISNLKFYRDQFKQDQYNEPLLQFFMNYLNDAQKPPHIKTQIWDLSKELIKTKYSDKYDNIDRIIHLNAPHTQHNVKNNVTKSNTYKTSNKILIYTGWMTHLWNQSHVNDKALGGSEKAVVYLSQQFPTTYDIIISGDVEEGSFNNITYIHQNNLQSILDKTEFHTVIISRYICFLERFKNIKTNKLLLSLHDTDIIKCDFTIDIPTVIQKYINHIDNVIVLTNYHKSVISSKYPMLNDKFTIINNGIDVDVDKSDVVNDEPDSNMNKNLHSREKIPNKFVYTSCSYRGLNTLLNMWPNILSVLPDATLDISSYDTFPKNDDDAHMLNIINQHSSSITHHGKLNKRDLYNMISKAEYWFYPTHFHETSCITALEMLLNNTICIYYPIGALVDTIGNYGITVNGDNAIDTIVNLSTSKKALIRKNGREYALSCSWKNRYALWEKVIGLDCIDCSVADGTDGNKKKWCFYYHNFTIETVEQFINNQVNHDGGDYDILISNNKDEIMCWKPDKLSFVYAMFDESIIHSLSTNENRNKCEISILQTEPLNLPWRLNAILDIHTKYPSIKIYDYSKSNIKILNQHNITNCEYLSYNIQQDEFNKLTTFLSENGGANVNNGNNKLYDFGFIYNWKSLPVETQHIINPPRRSNVVDFLRNNGFKVNIIAGYDDDRDIELAKCKVVLNIHGQINNNPTPSDSECSNIFEHVRCDRLLETGYTVLSETSYELDHEFTNKYPNLKIINYADFFNIDIINNILDTNKAKKYCFIHSCNLENVGTYRLENLIQTLRVTECENIFDKIFINNIGLPIENIYGEKYEVTNCSRNSQLFENPTINLINDFSKENPNCYILYLHTKGIRYSKDDVPENDWINYMLYFLVEEYKNCISILDKNYDTVGCDYSIHLDQRVFNGYAPYPPPPHYSGNFWWANSNYLKNLPKLCMEKHERNAPEFWLFQNKPNFYNLHSSDLNIHIYKTYPKSAYARREKKEKTMSEMVDNLRTDKNTTHSYLDLYEKLLFTKKCTAKNILEIGIGHGEYDGICITNGGSIKLWHDYFLNANIYALDIVSIDNVWDGIKNNNRINLITSVDAYDTDFFTQTFLNKNIKFDILLDDGPHTLESMIQFIKLYVNVMSEDGILIIEDVESIDWIQSLTEVVPEYLQKYIKSYDLRNIKNRYDDIVFVINKNTLADDNTVKYNTNKVESDRVCDDTNNLMLQSGQLSNTDKFIHHEYHKYYEPVLKPFYNSHGSIVEIGIGSGVSLPIWASLFKNAHIYGVDKDTEIKNSEKYTILIADQSNVNDLNNLKKSLTDKNVFFINDDGSHIPEHQLLSFNTLFPIVAEGGFYIIEDIETSYWSRGECYGYKTNYGYKHPNSMIEIFKEAADIINREFIVDKTRLSNKIQHYDYIESITFARNCIIVKKNYNATRDYRFKQFI